MIEDITAPREPDEGRECIKAGDPTTISPDLDPISTKMAKVDLARRWAYIRVGPFR
jgi:hypothetical protein